MRKVCAALDQEQSPNAQKDNKATSATVGPRTVTRGPTAADVTPLSFCTLGYNRIPVPSKQKTL